MSATPPPIPPIPPPSVPTTPDPMPTPASPGRPAQGMPQKYRTAGTPEAPAAGAPAPVAGPAAGPAKKRSTGAWETIFRIAIILVVIASGILAYWSFNYRLAPLQQESRGMISKVSQLTTEMEQLERRWSEEQVKDIRARYRQVYQQLFPDQQSLNTWLGKLHEEATPLSLEVSVGFGEAVPHEGFETNVAVIPASISLEVKPTPGDVEGKTPYERILSFGQALAEHGKRADLAEFSVTGGVGSISRALLVFNLWAGDLGADALASGSSTNHVEAK